jgi:2-dehydropantoate 2-reductase
VRRYVVVGCGAVGGLYGARLAAAGHPLGFLARSDVEVLRRDGLRLDSVDGDLHLPAGSFAAASDPAELGVADVVVVALKTTQNGALPRLLPPLVGPGTTVVVLQNGLGVEATADAAAPAAAAVVGGMCFVCSAKVGPGHVTHQDYGAITLGVRRGPVTAAEAVAADLLASGVEATVAPDLVTARWTKLLWNIPFNGLTALHGVGTDVILGERRDDATAADMVVRTEAMVPYRSSMALDLAAGRPLEHGAIHGAAIEAAAAAGSAMPLVEALWRALDAVDPGATRPAG